MRLYVNMFGTKKLFCSFNSDVFRVIHERASPVVPRVGISFGILIRHRRLHRFDHRAARKIFTGYKFYSFVLPFCLLQSSLEYLGICLFQVFHCFSLS